MKYIRIATDSPDETQCVIRTRFLPHFASVTPLTPVAGSVAGWRIHHPTTARPPEFRRMDASWRDAKPMPTLDFELAVHERLDPALGAQVWLIHSINAAGIALDPFDTCELMLHTAAGTGGLDLESARELGILIVSIPDAAAEEIAQVILRELKSAQPTLRSPLHRPQRIGLVGLGSVGQVVAKLATEEKWEVWAHDPFKPQYAFDRSEARRAPLLELAGICDLVSIQIPLCSETRGLIGADYFKFQKPGQIVVNASAPEIMNPPLAIPGAHQIDLSVARAVSSKTALARGLEMGLELAALFLAGATPTHLLMDPPLPRAVKVEKM